MRRQFELATLAKEHADGGGEADSDDDEARAEAAAAQAELDAGMVPKVSGGVKGAGVRVSGHRHGGRGLSRSLRVRQ